MSDPPEDWHRRGTVTMTDVARHAGVSTMTVSNVINQRTDRVGEPTRQRVLAAIAELGYQVNVTARGLRTGRTGVVGLAVPTFESGYFAELAGRLADRFAGHGLRLVMERTRGERTAELAALAASHLRRYDGFVLSVVSGQTSDLERLGIGAPVVVIGERAAPAGFDHALMDNVGGARLATELLLATGSRRIALLGGPPVRSGALADGEPGAAQSMPELRTRGYHAALEAAGLPLMDELLVPSYLGTADGYQSTLGLIADGVAFDAVFALTDSAAIGALRALAEAGLRVPADVQVIGFDNLEAGRFAVPALSTIEPDNDAMADAICSLLVERMHQGEARAPGQIVMPEARLVERASTRSR
ncbi:LacI family DNA-binding transcriptional regulator [Flindersiella endophytica]